MSEKFSIEGLSDLREPTSVSFKKSDITSSDRTMSGNLVVDYIATKNTVSVSWSVLTDAEFRSLMSLIDSKRGKNEFFTLKTVIPGYYPSKDVSSDVAGNVSDAEQTDIGTEGENAPVTTVEGSDVEELILSAEPSQSENTATTQPSPANSSVIGTMTAYAEEVSYYPYFMSDGSVVWRDVSIEFSEV